ncbi:MAG: radical SAM protein [Candidatus Izemoplasmatales bacterium]
MPGYADLKHTILQNAAKEKIPAAGEFELTPRCNFACPMCYVRESVPVREKSTDWWKKTFRAAVDGGLLYALLTGGEPLSRPDFCELYDFLYDLGVKITVYTNASLVDGNVLQTFLHRPPEFVGITLYGHDAASVLSVTGNKNGFRDVETGIEVLASIGIPVALRTIPIRPIYEELDSLITYVKNKGMKLGYQLYVGPGRHDGLGDTSLRLSPWEVADFEARILAAFPAGETIETETRHSTCPALKSGCFVTWEGRMQPCATVSVPGKSFDPENYVKTFKELAERMEKIPSCVSCLACDLYADCLQCHARRTLEGSPSKCPGYLRELAIERRRRRDG